MKVYPLVEAISDENLEIVSADSPGLHRNFYKNGKLTACTHPAAFRSRMLVMGSMLWGYDSEEIQNLAADNGVDPQALLACEQARITYKLRKLGINLTTEDITEKGKQLLASKHDSLNDVIYGFVDGYKATGRHLLNRIAENPVIETSIDCAKTLGFFRKEDLFLRTSGFADEEPDETGDVEFFYEMSYEEFLDAIKGEGKCPLSPSEKSKMGSSYLDEQMKMQFKHGGKGYAPPGEMKIKLHKDISATMPPSKFSRKWRANDEGTLPRYLNRYFIDGKIFGYKKRHQGGTVLVDVSGSMSLSSYDIAEVLRLAPGCTIATYSGQTKSGTLQIIAKNGRCVKNWRNTTGGSNVVDYPALKWLAKQQHPRLWISDGVVTGVGDFPSRQMFMMCVMVAKRAWATRLSHMEEAKAFFKKRYKRA